MRDWFLCLFGAALISGVVCMAADGSGFEKHIRYLCALVCVVVTVAPLAGLTLDEVGYLPSYSEPEQRHDSLYAAADVAEERVREYISGLLIEKFGISCTGVRIDLYSEGEGVTVQSVTAYIDGGDAEAAAEYLARELGGAIEVKYDGAV